MPPRKRAAEIADGDAESSVGGTGAAASVRGPRKKRARLFAPAAAEVNDSDRESTPAPAALVSFSSESPASFAGRTSAARLAAQKAFESRNRTPASSPAVRAPRRSGGGPPKPTEGPDFVEWGDDEGAPVRLSELPEWLDDLGYRFQQCSGAKKSKAGTPPFIVRYLGEDPRRRDPREVELAVDANPDAAPAAIAAAIEKGYRVAGFSFRCCGLPSCPPTGDACPFEMRIVIYANDIHRAHIFVRGYHPPPPQDERGRSSAILRRDAYAYFLRSGTTPASFLAEYAKEINDRGGIKLETLKAIAARARRNAVGAPTHALLLKLASDHPDTVCLINFDAEEGRLKQFACAFTSETGFVYAVLYWLYVGIDTSFRRKTSDRMPVTGLVAIDPNTGQGRPLTLLVSTNIRQPVLEAFLDWFRKRVRRFARDLLYKPRREWPVALRSARADVERAAEGWSPRCWVLDKSRAELNALKAIFGDDILCRLCTFHILQAFRRHEKVDHGEGDEEEEGAQEARPTETKIPNKIRKAVGRAFVDLCRRAVDDEDWDTRVKELLELTVPQIVQKHTQAGGHRADIVRSICFYLRRNWLCDLWKPLTARYLLPEDIDIKMIFTNNPTEAAWRVLDRVILRGSFHFITAIVKLMRVWDYCEARDRAGKRPLNRDVKKAMAEGLALWEAGHVVEVTPHRVFHVRRSNGDQAVVILGPPCSIPRWGPSLRWRARWTPQPARKGLLLRILLLPTPTTWARSMPKMRTTDRRRSRRTTLLTRKEQATLRMRAGPATDRRWRRRVTWTRTPDRTKATTTTGSATRRTRSPRTPSAKGRSRTFWTTRPCTTSVRLPPTPSTPQTSLKVPSLTTTTRRRPLLCLPRSAPLWCRVARSQDVHWRPRSQSWLNARHDHPLHHRLPRPVGCCAHGRLPRSRWRRSPRARTRTRSWRGAAGLGATKGSPAIGINRCARSTTAGSSASRRSRCTWGASTGSLLGRCTPAKPRSATAWCAHRSRSAGGTARYRRSRQTSSSTSPAGGLWRCRGGGGLIRWPRSSLRSSVRAIRGFRGLSRACCTTRRRLRNWRTLPVIGARCRGMS
ncbi:hypothetical protein DFJ74DRAFT_386954 [Hyaloraphidium curvatum]|nr:hypothetical protein DFJ74DRAFT_386954 [Hyaloraphidium curvatum]